MAQGQTSCWLAPHEESESRCTYATRSKFAVPPILQRSSSSPLCSRIHVEDRRQRFTRQHRRAGSHRFPAIVYSSRAQSARQRAALQHLSGALRGSCRAHMWTLLLLTSTRDNYHFAAPPYHRRPLLAVCTQPNKCEASMSLVLERNCHQQFQNKSGDGGGCHSMEGRKACHQALCDNQGPIF